jgi:hypothetical protein
MMIGVDIGLHVHNIANNICGFGMILAQQYFQKSCENIKK